MVGEGYFSGGGVVNDEETWEIGIAGDEEEPRRPIMRGKHFDIEAYARNYRGRTKIIRLLFIANRCRDDAQKLEALRIAYDEAKTGKDVRLFTRVAMMISGSLGPKYQMDEDWCRSVNQTWDQVEDMLDSWAVRCEEDYERNVLSADGVRTAYYYIGDVHYVHGATMDALHYYWKTRTFCRNQRTAAETLWRVITILIEKGQYGFARDAAENVLEYVNPDKVTVAKAFCVMGWAFLMKEQFRSAADKFLEISREMGNQFSELMASHDIATYGGLCALASLERTELKSRVIDNDDFQFYLDSAIGIRELICDFYSCRFASCFKRLANLRERLLLDIHLYEVFEALHQDIIQNALALYIQPFLSVDLQRMANVFATSIETLELELADMIESNKIQAKIDKIDKVLYVQRDQRKATLLRFQESCIVIEHNLRQMLLRTAYFSRRRAYVEPGESSICQKTK